MTENEVRKYIEELREKARLFGKSGYATAGMEKAFNKSANTIENLLNELESYREIGTVEGYKRAIEISKENFRVSMEYKAKVQEYEAIGTIEEFKALKNKHIGKDNMVISSSDLMTILNSDSEELKSLKDENAYLHSELQAIGATADMFEKEIREKAIDEFVGMLEFSLMNNYRHLLKIDMDEFEWLTTDSVLTHIRKVKEQLKGGAV